MYASAELVRLTDASHSPPPSNVAAVEPVLTIEFDSNTFPDCVAVSGPFSPFAT